MAVESEARVVDTLLVYTISSSNYTGGAHGMYSINCHNYSIAGGYELALSDLFDAARQEALIGLIRNKLYEQFGVTGTKVWWRRDFSRIHFHDREFRSDRGRHYVLL